jgi:predicted transcriptional regulator of viral defense system
MEIKNTILSQKDLELLEAIVLCYGKLVSFDQILAIVGSAVSRGAVQKRVAQLSKAGWLVRLKRGLYLVVTDVSTLGFTDISDLVIALALNNHSYISFERALQHHGLFDQLLARVDCVTTGKTKTYRVLDTTYTFAQIKRERYFGFIQETIQGHTVNIAEKEKAILDILYFRTTDYAISLVLEKLAEYQDEFDFAKLKAYSARVSLGMVRKIGFLLDCLGVDTADLMTEEVKKSSYNKLTEDADQFNAKWRLYYDSHLSRQSLQT